MKFVIIILTLVLKPTFNNIQEIDQALVGKWLDLETATIVSGDTLIRNNYELNHTLHINGDGTFYEENYLVPNQPINRKGKWKLVAEETNSLKFYEIETVPNDPYTKYGDFEYEVITDKNSPNELILKNKSVLIYTKYNRTE